MNWRELNRTAMKGMLVVLSGGTLLGGVSNCEPAVQSAVVNGLQSASQSLVTGLLNALFLSFTPDSEVLTTVKAIVDELPTFLG